MRHLHRAMTRQPGGKSQMSPGIHGSRWLRAREPRPVAVALVLHGMNTRPARMVPMARLLNRRGVDCLLATLPGHDGDLHRLQRVTRDSLLSAVAAAHREVEHRSRELSVPLLLVGFSLGALLANDLANHRPGVAFDRMILLAPAFTPPPGAALLRLLAPFPGLVLPSALPTRYRVHPGTPVAAYRALFASVAALRRTVLAASRVPTLLFADPRDRLMSTARLVRMIVREQLTDWRLVEVHSRLCRSHLVIDPDAVGPAGWARMAAEIDEFIGAPGGRRLAARPATAPGVRPAARRFSLSCTCDPSCPGPVATAVQGTRGTR